MIVEATKVTSKPNNLPSKLLPFALLLVALATAWWFWGRTGKVASPRDESLTYSGVVEARSTDVAFETNGTVREILVEEGDAVAPDQVLARLDIAAAQANLDQAAARMEVASANLRLLRNGPRRVEIEGAQARLRQAQADLEQLRNGATGEELATLQASAEAARQGVGHRISVAVHPAYAVHSRASTGSVGGAVRAKILTHNPLARP